MSSTTFTLSIQIINDFDAEPTETFHVLLSNPTGATIDSGDATITILDDEPTVSVTEATGGEGSLYENQVSFLVQLLGGSMPPNPNGVTVHYSVNFGPNDTASSADVDSTSGSITIYGSAGVIHIPVIDDNLVEGTETFHLTLDSAVGAHLASPDNGGSTIGWIEDDDNSNEVSPEAFGFAWEGGRLNFFLGASVAAGDITGWDVDIDDDGTFDVTATPEDYSAEGQAAFLFDVDQLSLLGSPADDGIYPATLRIRTASGVEQSWNFNIEVGNVPAGITPTGPDSIAARDMYSLEVTTSDRGPDTVTNLSVDWGDGSSVSSSSGSSGAFTHAYEIPGEYIIEITATDEDGPSYYGYTITVMEPARPTISSGSASLNGGASTTATLTVQANDIDGNPIPDGPSYSWDTDGDGVFGDATGQSVTLSPDAPWVDGPNPDPDATYRARVSITDSTGHSIVVSYKFSAPGQVDPFAAEGTGVEHVAPAAAPNGFDVNLTLQIVKELRPDVHDWWTQNEGIVELINAKG